MIVRQRVIVLMVLFVLALLAQAGGLVDEVALAQPAASGVSDQQVARGTVFEDADGNGIRDAGEPGIAEVCVSNGRDVVRTAPDGGWALSVSDDTALFVIKPAGYAVPLNAQQVPQFYYLHKPNGSPPLEAPGVAPTGPLPESIDFALRPQQESDRFTALFFGDTQARGMTEVNYVTHDVVEECFGTKAPFGVTLGDIVADDPNLFAEISQTIAQIGVPWYYVFGNHDYNRAAKSDQYSDETFEHFFGPSTYAFEYGRVAFLVLKDFFYKPEGGYKAHLSDDQLAFIRGYLATVPSENLVVLMTHVPIIVCDNREDLFRLIEDRPRVLTIAAHAHEQLHVFAGAEMGWRGKEPLHQFVNATVCGSWWCGAFDELGIPHATMNDGAPNGYSLIAFAGNRYRIRFKAARRPAGYQMNIYLPDDIEQAKAGQTEILVNVFAGSERSKVEMRLDEGPWTPLERTVTIDPECLWMHEQGPYLDEKVLGKPLEEVFGSKMDYPSESYHMWKGPLPENPPLGTHTVTVRTTDMFGQTWQAQRIVRVR